MRKSYLSVLLCLCLVMCGLVARATAGMPVVSPLRDTTACTGTTIMFIANVIDTPATDSLAYVWQVSADSGASWSAITSGGAYSGAMSDTLQITLSSSLNGDRYRVIVTDGDSSRSDTSNAATVTVDVPSDPLPISGPATTCVGSVIRLMDGHSSGGTFTWSTSNGNASVNDIGQVTGIANGRDTITYTFTNTCNTVTSHYTVTIDTPIDPGTITGPDTLCAGSSITLADTTAGGTWLSSNYEIAVVDGSGNVIGVAQGSAIISYYFSNSCGARAATLALTVQEIAATITGGDSVGIGHTLTLRDSATGGVWSTSNSHILVNSMGVITGLSAGRDTIYYTVTNVCGTTQSMLSVLAGTTPSAGRIVGFDTVCRGSSLQLYDSTSAISGTWSAKNGYATVNASGVVTGVSQGTDTVYYSVNNAFGSSVNSFIIYVDVPPVVTVDTLTSVGIGDTYVLMGTPAGGIWSSHLRFVTDTTSITYDTVSGKRDTIYTSDTLTNVASVIEGNLLVVTGNGIDTIFYTVTNLCGTGRSDFIIKVTTATAGVSQVNAAQNEMNVYPNPSNGSFKIHIYSGRDENAILTVSNIAGEKMASQTIPTNTDASIMLDVPSGMYLINVVTSEGAYSRKINIIH